DRLYRRLELGTGESEDAIRRAACADASFAAQELRRAAAALSQAGNSDGPRGERLAAWLADAANRHAIFDDYLDLYFKQDGGIRSRLATKEALKGAPGIDQVLLAEARRLEIVMERCRAAANAEGTAALIRLGAALAERYKQAKSD